MMMNEIPDLASPSSLGVVTATCVSKVELRVCCKNLLDRDTLNKSDPCVLLLMQSQGQWMEVRDTVTLNLVNIGTFFGLMCRLTTDGAAGQGVGRRGILLLLVFTSN